MFNSIPAFVRKIRDFVRKEPANIIGMAVFLLVFGGSVWTSLRLAADPLRGCDRLTTLSEQAACLRAASADLLFVAIPLGVIAVGLMTAGVVNIILPRKN